jgi:hypothetical protein
MDKREITVPKPLIAGRRASLVRYVRFDDDQQRAASAFRTRVEREVTAVLEFSHPDSVAVDERGTIDRRRTS